MLLYIMFSYIMTRQENGSKRLYEVHYKNSFVQHHPSGEKIRGIERLVLPVSMLCHITHKSQAEEIRKTHTHVEAFAKWFNKQP